MSRLGMHSNRLLTALGQLRERGPHWRNHYRRPQRSASYPFLTSLRDSVAARKRNVQRLLAAALCRLGRMLLLLRLAIAIVSGRHRPEYEAELDSAQLRHDLTEIAPALVPTSPLSTFTSPCRFWSKASPLLRRSLGAAG